MARFPYRIVRDPAWILTVLAAFCGPSVPDAPAKPPVSLSGAPVRPPDAFEIRLASRSFTPTPAPPRWDVLSGVSKTRQAHAIVQLWEAPDADCRAALAKNGIVLGQPLTGHAYLATVRRDVVAASPTLKAIRWAGPLAADDKIAPELRQQQLAPWARRVRGRLDLVVKAFPDGSLDAIVERAKALGGTLLGEARVASVITVSLPEGRERELAALDDVRYIEPLLPRGEPESDRARAHVHADVGVIPAGHANGGGVIVGVFDSGNASSTHPDLVNRCPQGDARTYSPDGHATMTAGMIAGDGSRSLAQGATAQNQWRGIAPAAQCRSYGYGNAGGADSITNYLNDVADAVQNDGVSLLNNSWGDSGCATFPYGSYAGRAPFLDGVVTGSLGRPVSIVFSAGNERFGYDVNNVKHVECITNTSPPYANYTTLNHPKSAKNVIVVGAIDSFNDAMSEYSSWGPTLDGRIKPDVVASGHHRGTMGSGVSMLDNPFGHPTGSSNQQDYRAPIYNPQYVYGWFSQTSSAAAIVSGGLALLLDDWRRTFPGRGDPLPSSLRALLVHTARDLDDATAWYNPGPDYASGYGLVQIAQAEQSIERGDILESSVANQGLARFFIDVPAGTPQVKVTLAWDDPPAAENANPALINDLDLVITDPTGTRRYPWTLNPTSPTTNAIRTQEDHTNNLEQVVVDSPAAGSWAVTVRGTSVAQGPQSFSLISANHFSIPSVDLVVASCSHAPTTPTTTTLITFTAVVRNNGTIEAPPSTLSFRIGGETPPGRTIAVPALPPRGSFTATRQLTLGVAQNYRNTMIADFDGRVAESNESNNVCTEDYTVGPPCQNGATRDQRCVVDGGPGTRHDVCVAGAWQPGQCVSAEVCSEPDERWVSCPRDGHLGFQRLVCRGGKWVKTGGCVPNIP